MKQSNINPEIAERLNQLLKEKGVELEFYGCGCCDSPDVTIRIDGETLLESEQDVMFSNLGETK